MKTFPRTVLLAAPALLALAQLAPVQAAPAGTGPSSKALSTSTRRQTSVAPAVILRAATDEKRYTSGQPIEVTLVAANTSRRRVVLNFSSGQRFDFSIFRAGTREAVYTWSASRMFLQAKGTLALRPGQRQRYDATVRDEMGALPPGKYRLVARLTNSPRPVVAPPIAFEVVDLGLAISARTDKTAYKIGEPVQIGVSVANRLARQNSVPFGSGLTFDVIITDEAGKFVWSYGANLRFIRVLGQVTWAPMETKEYSTEWNGVALPTDEIVPKLTPGRYRVQAVLASTPLLYAKPIDIDITS